MCGEGEGALFPRPRIPSRLYGEIKGPSVILSFTGQVGQSMGTVEKAAKLVPGAYQ